MIDGRNRHLDDLKVAVIGEAVRKPRKKKHLLLSITVCWLFNRDPCNGLI